MNPLTQVKNLQKITQRETDAGFSGDASWHMSYKDSAYIYAGGLDFKLSEGDLLAVFAQYGEVVDVNLVRDRGTGDSKGFAFLAYEDQRSTILAVDNLNGAKVGNRIIRVDHVKNYRKKKEEDEEERQRKREENGVCYDFQRGHCSRGDSCKYSHNEKRNENTGWGADEETKWKHDQYRDERRPESRKPVEAGRDGDDRKRSRGGHDEPARKRSKDDDIDERRRSRDDHDRDYGDSKYDRDESRRSRARDYDRDERRTSRDDSRDDHRHPERDHRRSSGRGHRDDYRDDGRRSGRD